MYSFFIKTVLYRRVFVVRVRYTGAIQHERGRVVSPLLSTLFVCEFNLVEVDGSIFFRFFERRCLLRCCRRKNGTGDFRMQIVELNEDEYVNIE